MPVSDNTQQTCPLTREQVIERYFMEHRAKLLDLAAFLDRVDRAAPENDAVGEDFRLRAFREALAILQDNAPGRASRVQEVFSDPTDEPLDSAANMKGASGAYPGKT